MITRAKPKRFAGHVLQLRQRPFFRGQIGLEVEVCGRKLRTAVAARRPVRGDHVVARSMTKARSAAVVKREKSSGASPHVRSRSLRTSREFRSHVPGDAPRCVRKCSENASRVVSMT